MSDKINPIDIKKIFDRGKVIPEDGELLYRVCEMVYRVHYRYNYDAMDDLIQEGILGIISLVDLGVYEESRGDILTFVYTRVRNCMSNYLYHEMKLTSKSVGDEHLKWVGYDESDSSWFGFVSEEMVLGIFDYVNNKLEEFELSEDLVYCVRVYFKDKLGIKHDVNVVRDYSLDFVDKYRYYVNLIEHEVFVKFINRRVFDNKIDEILDVLEAEGDVGFFMRMFLNSLNEEQLTRLMYVFSANSFQFPQKYKLLKVDNYLSIYRKVKHGNMSIEEVARFFEKPVPTILSIVQKYDIIFS